MHITSIASNCPSNYSVCLLCLLDIGPITFTYHIKMSLRYLTSIYFPRYHHIVTFSRYMACICHIIKPLRCIISKAYIRHYNVFRIFHNEYRCQDTYIYFIRQNIYTYNSKTNNTKLLEYNSIIKIIQKILYAKTTLHHIKQIYGIHIVNQCNTLNAANNIIKDRPI